MRLQRPHATGVGLGVTGLAALLALLGPTAHAGGRLIATGGATQIEGAAGGGLVPWAVLGGYGTRGQNGATAFVTAADTGDYRLSAAGAAWVWNNRLELSLARQALALPAPGGRLGQNILGAKLRLAGNAVYGPWPQISLGVQHKRTTEAVPAAIPAEADRGTDVYLSAGRVFFARLAGRNVYLNAGLRSTEANELGLLGFGGPAGDGRDWVFDGAAAVFLDRRTAVGVEYRQKPEQLGAIEESDWTSAFVAWFPSKQVSLTAAWVDLGTVATLSDQRGLYLSVEAAF
jgi:hypothetical protein